MLSYCCLTDLIYQMISDCLAFHNKIIKPTIISPPCISSVPCVPTDVEVKMRCSKNQAVVSWSASEGALSYKVTAQSSEGAMLLCESATLMCTLTNLTCGQSYSVQVVAQDNSCSSLPSPPTNFSSGKAYISMCH